MKYRNLYLYNKLQVLKKDIKRVLTEEIETKASFPIVKKSNVEEPTKTDIQSTIVSYTKLQASSIPKENDVIVSFLDNLMDESVKSSKEVKFKVSKINVNITTLLNEIKTFTDNENNYTDAGLVNDIKETRDAVARISKIYSDVSKSFEDAIIMFDAHKAKYNNYIKMENELEKRIEKMRKEVRMELLAKYNLVPKDIKDVEKILNIQAEESSKESLSKSAVDKELKDIIRNVKNIVSSVTDIEEQIISNSKMFVTGFGRTVGVSRTSKGYYMLEKGGFEIIKENPELFEKLSGMVRYIEPEDKVIGNITGDKQDTALKIGTYFSQHKGEIDTVLKSLDDVKEEMNEGISSMFNGFIKMVSTKYKLVFSKISSIYSKINNKYQSETKSVVDELDNYKVTLNANTQKLASSMQSYIISYKKSETKILEKIAKSDDK